MQLEIIVSVLSIAPAPQDALSSYRGVRPADPSRSRASGPAPYRVLALGGRMLAGHGVLTHDLALTGALARELARQVGHGFDVESILLERPTVSATTRALRTRDLSAVDALVLILDHEDDIAGANNAVERVHRLVDELWHRLAPAASITVVVPPASMTGRHPAELSAFTAELRAAAAPLTRVVQLVDRLALHGAAEHYAVWGETIAAAVSQSLTEPLVWIAPVERLDERRRQAAVRRLGPRDEVWEAAFHRIVTFAASAYGARSAALSVVDGDQVRYYSRRGFDRVAMDREQTLCDVALRTYGGVIVGDARTDDRFRDLPIVRDGEVRFYAGHRIEDGDGQPIGTLCVFDAEPRPVLSQDLALLRDFATSAERRIWELTPRRGSLVAAGGALGGRR